MTKPGIIYSNVMTAGAGYLFASRWHIQPLTVLSLLLGTGLIIASACVVNNYLDRGIDAKMARTRMRALVTREISVRQALLFGFILGLTGFLALWQTNLTTVLVGVVAWVSYVILYGYAKRHSVHGTLVGTIPGAASLVAGYTAVTARFDLAAVLLLAVMVTWQMAHFYSIATFRLSDYKAAGIPVRPVVKGITNTKHHIVIYVVLFIVATLLLKVFGYEGWAYLVAVLLIGMWWLRQALRGLRAPDDSKWARRTFFSSLVVLLVFSTALAVGVVLP